jgi:hypothetical protein
MPCLSGSNKTVESRLTKTGRVPFGSVKPGERVFVKQSGGRFVATAVAGQVWSYPSLTPAKIDGLPKQFQSRVGGDDAYWESKRDSLYATFVELTHAELIEAGPAYKPAYMKAWYLLDEAVSPLREVELTGGAIRNGYLRLPGVSETMLESLVTLELPDGSVVQTGFSKDVMLRWRGWRGLYADHHMKPGDVVRLLALGDRRYRVSFHPR